MRKFSYILLLLFLFPGTGAFAQPFGGQHPKGWDDGNALSFLSRDDHVGCLSYLPAPPERGTAAFYNDSLRYEQGKLLRAGNRGEMAVRDADLQSASVMQAFSEAIGFTISESTCPETFKLIAGAMREASKATFDAKRHYQRKRPYVEFCEETSIPSEEESHRSSGSYPSGHSSMAWAGALIIGELFPASSDAALRRAYEFGQSRVIAGYHYQSDVDAGKMVGGAVVSRLHANGKFMRQLEKAKEEILCFSPQEPLMVGAAVRDITPTKKNGLLPIAGIGKNVEMTGVIQPVHTRVIAFAKGETRALMICTETGKGPLGDRFCKIISEHTGVPVENIFYTTTHSHAVPELVFGDFTLEPVKGESNTVKWARLALENMLSAADEALSELQPVRAYIGVGESYIGVNRNFPYTFDDGSHKRNLGPYLKGDMDPTLFVLRFDDMSGTPVAFISNYACHAVTMIGNTALNGKPGVDSDFPGQVSMLLEERNPGTVAMWTSGAAGDINPFVSNQIMYPDPDTGKGVTVSAGEVHLREQVAYIHYDDIKRVLREGMRPLRTDRLACAEDSTVIPVAEGKEPARESLQLLRIGDVAFLGIPGELYSSVGKYIREYSALPYTMVVDNTWNWPDSDLFYIEDDEGVSDPGFGGNHGFLPGTIGPKLAELANRLISKTE